MRTLNSDSDHDPTLRNVRTVPNDDISLFALVILSPLVFQITCISSRTPIWEERVRFCYYVPKLLLLFLGRVLLDLVIFKVIYDNTSCKVAKPNVAIQPHGSYAPAASAWLGNCVACVKELLQMDT